MTTMAKKKLPSTTKPRKPAKKASSTILTTVINAPLAQEIGDGYIPEDLDCGRLPIHVRRPFKQLLRGLQDSGAMLRSGKHVRFNKDAILWFLEQLEMPAGEVDER